MAQLAIALNAEITRNKAYVLIREVRNERIEKLEVNLSIFTTSMLFISIVRLTAVINKIITGYSKILR